MITKQKSPVFSFEDLNYENAEYLWPLMGRATSMFQLEPNETTQAIVNLLMDDYRAIRNEFCSERKVLATLTEARFFRGMITWALQEFMADPCKEGAEELIHYLVSCWGIG